MMQMFQSATLKLTGWYLLILMTISITFSVVIYQLNSRELNFRLESLQHSLTDGVTFFTPSGPRTFSNGPSSPLSQESQKASGQMALSLIYINAVVLLAGGLGSYFLARRTLQPIERAHESQSRFTSDASHELRTPLAAMKTELEVTLRDKNLAIDEAREVLESNLEEVNKLIRLSEMLLSLSRLEHGTLEQTKLNLVEITTEALSRYGVDTKRFEVTAPKNVFLTGNRAAITELLSVLIDNALKYSPAKSLIHVRLFTQRGIAGFEIHNEGDHIPQEKLDKLFDRFYRADTSRTNSATNGYGLGLSIAKKITELHHGEITVRSNKKGTKFTILLPNIRKVSDKAHN